MGVFFVGIHTILFSQNVGIGTISPLARLHVVDSAVVFSTSHYAYWPSTLQISGTGKRLMWLPNKGAFRVGIVNGAIWDNDSIGYSSFAAGYNSKATNSYSTAIGYICNAQGYASFAAGYFCNSLNYYSTALGAYSEAIGFTSNSFGYNTQAMGDYSTALGYYTKAKAMGSISMGSYTNDDDIPAPDNPLPADRIFQLGNGTFSDRKNAITVLRNGNVGIGIVNPIVKLHAFKGSAGGSLPFGDVAIEGTNSAYFSTLTPDNAESGIIFGINSNNLSGNIIYNNAGTKKGFQFRTYDNSPRMIIDSTGKVGIGTLIPVAPLSFPGSTGDKISLWGDGSPTHYGLGIQNGFLQLFAKTVNDNIVFGYGNSGFFTEVMRIKCNGNVGIGNTNPSQRLSVTGNICATGSIGSCSDIRYKTNVLPLTHALSSILSLQGILYNWDRESFPQMEFSDTRQIGFSAQEVEKFYPEIVSTGEDGYKSVDYGKLTPVLAEAIKEQQEQINGLKQENAKMMKELTELRALIQDVRKQK